MPIPWSERIIAYNNALHFAGRLPRGIRMMNPYAESEAARSSSEAFYRKYYSDLKPRRLILGINPGRHGAGATGIPFTDPKKLVEIVQIPWHGAISHEPSSVFIYDMIHAYGGPEAFYMRYYISSVSPLGYTIGKKDGSEVNFNYYDTSQLLKRVTPFIKGNLEALAAMGLEMDTCYCLGVRNAAVLTEINRKGRYFREILPLEHPRYIMQYKLKNKDVYIQKYLETLK